MHSAQTASRVAAHQTRDQTIVGDGTAAHDTRQAVEDDELLSASEDNFRAVLCHELNTPLASIQNAVGVLRAQRGGNEVQQGMHALIDRQVRHMSLLIADLLDESRINSGHVRLRAERVDLRTVVRNAIQSVEWDIKQRNHRITATWPASPVWLHADASRLEQVFVNLLINGSKYTDPGGDLALSVNVHDASAVVRVRDYGIGIAPDVLPHIFELFVQADEAVSRSRHGLGVGLALVRHLVERHGGSVSAASAGLGHGSEFTVRLPAQT